VPDSRQTQVYVQAVWELYELFRSAAADSDLAALPARAAGRPVMLADGAINRP
jgi:hypothetical protein